MNLGQAPSYPASPGFKEPDTSRDAAEAMVPRANRLQKKCLAALHKAAEAGLTADEAAEALAEDRLSIRPRFTELKARRQICTNGERRRNTSQRWAKVWVLC